MKRRIFALVGVVALVGLLLPAAIFAVEDTVSCTVTAALVSVTVTDGDVAYGTVAVGASRKASELGDTQTVTNDGTVIANLYIRSSDATRDGGTNWTLAVAAGHNEFEHRWDTGEATWSAMLNSYLSMGGNIWPGDSVSLDLQITMPTSTDDYLEHSITVTVLASL